MSKGGYWYNGLYGIEYRFCSPTSAREYEETYIDDSFDVTESTFELTLK
jgi:hypothetical protein